MKLTEKLQELKSSIDELCNNCLACVKEEFPEMDEAACNSLCQEYCAQLKTVSEELSQMVEEVKPENAQENLSEASADYQLLKLAADENLMNRAKEYVLRYDFEEAVQKLKETILAESAPQEDLDMPLEAPSEDQLAELDAEAEENARLACQAAKFLLKDEGVNVDEKGDVAVDAPELSAEESMEALAGIADKFDSMGLVKEASVLDEILLTIGSNKKALAQFNYEQEDKINKLRAKYRQQQGDEAYAVASREHAKQIGSEEMAKAVEKNIKKYRPMEAALSSRYSPDLPGVQLIRVGDSVFQCPITGKVYDFREGFTTAKGNKVPGGSVDGQTRYFGSSDDAGEVMFSSRQERLNK